MRSCDSLLAGTRLHRISVPVEPASTGLWCLPRPLEVVVQHAAQRTPVCVSIPLSICWGSFLGALTLCNSIRCVTSTPFSAYKHAVCIGLKHGACGRGVGHALPNGCGSRAWWAGPRFRADTARKVATRSTHAPGSQQRTRPHPTGRIEQTPRWRCRRTR